ncbi:MAG TPA: right-handed parallel beta-helix repeat-containing protein [Gaiellaceae bacterium]|nr:right-handed parallel beta-helix repeat-containing protein [Gaiellaceae bacterium]
MGKLLRTGMGVLVVAVVGLAAVPAQARGIQVNAGQSIQAAIDAAHPGDTIRVGPGVFQENLTITKNRIHVVGAGIGQTVLEPGAEPTGPCADPTIPETINGVCVIGDFAPFATRKDALIKGFTIRNFPGFGVFAFNVSGLTVDEVEAEGNGGYGISGFVLHKVTFTDSIAHDNGEPGFYIGDSEDAAAVVKRNLAYRNGTGGEEGDGILIRDSSNGVVSDNTVFGNCVGINVVDSGEAPIPAANWRVTDNTATGNNAPCAGEPDGPPPISGIGILVLGAANVLVEENTVTGNGPGAGGGPLPPGGIVVLSSLASGGADPTGVKVHDNKATDNTPWDIFWDESGTGNTFPGNHCAVSSPSWICS